MSKLEKRLRIFVSFWEISPKLPPMGLAKEDEGGRWVRTASTVPTSGSQPLDPHLHSILEPLSLPSEVGSTTIPSQPMISLRSFTLRDWNHIWVVFELLLVPKTYLAWSMNMSVSDALNLCNCPCHEWKSSPEMKIKKGLARKSKWFEVPSSKRQTLSQTQSAESAWGRWCANWARWLGCCRGSSCSRWLATSSAGFYLAHCCAVQDFFVIWVLKYKISSSWATK